MTAAIVIIIGLSLMFGLGILVGAVIKFGHEIDEQPMPGEPDQRLVDLHREIHTTRWEA